jgi:hypothetical protein
MPYPRTENISSFWVSIEIKIVLDIWGIIHIWVWLIIVSIKRHQVGILCVCLRFHYHQNTPLFEGPCIPIYCCIDLVFIVYVVRYEESYPYSSHINHV